MLAGRALDLFAAVAFVAPDVLGAMRAGEFEFAHKSFGHVCDACKRPRTHPHRRVIHHCEIPGAKGSKLFELARIAFAVFVENRVVIALREFEMFDHAPVSINDLEALHSYVLYCARNFSAFQVALHYK